MINRYEYSINEFIVERKAIHNSIDGISVELGEWDSVVWGKSPNAYRFLRKNWGSVKESYTYRNISDCSIIRSECVGDYYQSFIKAYISYLYLEEGKGATRLLTVAHMFLDLCFVLEIDSTPLSQIAVEHIKVYFRRLDELYKKGTKESKVAALCGLLEFMEERGMLVHPLNVVNPYKYENSSFQKRNQLDRRIPTLENVNAIAEIYDRTMRLNYSFESSGSDILDIVACSVVGIIFSTPVRVSEIDLLSYGSLIIEKFKEKNIYTLCWRGSKGMVDHHKHIQADMFPTVSRSLSALESISEKARVLCRYYEDPEKQLKAIFGEFKVEIPKGVKLNASISLWQLGALLGFYNATNIEDILNTGMRHPDLGKGDVKFASICQGFPYEVNGNELITPRMAAKLLLNSTSVSSSLSKVFGDEVLTMCDVETLWIDYVRSNFKDFPFYIVGAAKKKIFLSSSLILVNGMYSAIKPFNCSPFMIAKPRAGQLITTRFSNVSEKRNLFRKYGYDSGVYKFTSHQARHFLNTLAQRSDLSEEIVALWSGRTNIKQNKVYNHESSEELDAKFLAIGVAPKGNAIIPISIEEFEDVSGVKFASKTITGFCTQSLHVNPCTYLKVGMSGCTGCTKHCYIKGDKAALTTLQEDMQIQVQRLESSLMEQCNLNPIMKRWFDVHVSNIKFIDTLISLLKRDDIEDGSIIRFNGGQKFRVVNDQDVHTIEVKFQLPNSLKCLVENTVDSVSCDKGPVDHQTPFDSMLASMNLNTKEKN